MTCEVKAKKILYALIDISGTIQRGNGKPVVDGAITAIQQLMNSLGHHNVLFLTNTTTVSRITLLKELHDNGFSRDITINHIMTGSQAVCHYVQKHQLHPYCLVEDDLLQDLLFLKDISVAQDNHQKQIQQTEQKENSQVQKDENEAANVSGSCGNQASVDDSDIDEYDSVLVGLSPSNFQYNALNRAYRILYKQYSAASSILPTSSSDKNRFLCFHRSQYVKDTDGLLSLGPGSFISCLEDAMIASCSKLNKVNFSAHILGKPSIGFYQAALQQLVHRSSSGTEISSDTDPDCESAPNRKYANVVMIGDDYRNDIIGALNVQIRYQILVQTGKYMTGDELKVRDHPNYESIASITLPSIVVAVAHILAINEH
jgi:HAD superfamily hydrolase (TIGR01450 family)